MSPANTLYIVVATRECCVSVGFVTVLPFVIVVWSVLVAAVSAKHAILPIATNSMANTMLVGMMLLDVVCGDAAAK